MFAELAKLNLRLTQGLCKGVEAGRKGEGQGEPRDEVDTPEWGFLGPLVEVSWALRWG